MTYEEKIDEIAKRAAKVANGTVLKKHFIPEGKDVSEYDKTAYDTAWNKVYHDTIEKIAFDEGVRGSRKFGRVS